MAQPLRIEPLPASFTVNQLIGLLSMIDPVAWAHLIRLRNWGWFAGIVELERPEDGIVAVRALQGYDGFGGTLSIELLSSTHTYLGSRRARVHRRKPPHAAE
jgi:hypothetical protein